MSDLQSGIVRLTSAARAHDKVQTGLKLVDTVLKLGEGAGVPLIPAVCIAARGVLQVVQASRTVINDALSAAQRTIDVLELLQLMAENVKRMDVTSRASVEDRMRELQRLLEDVGSAVAAFGKKGWLRRALKVKRRSAFSQLDTEITDQLDQLLTFYNITRDAHIIDRLQAREYAVEGEVARQLARLRLKTGETVEEDALEKDSEVVRAIAAASGLPEAELTDEMRGSCVSVSRIPSCDGDAPIGMEPQDWTKLQELRLQTSTESAGVPARDAAAAATVAAAAAVAAPAPDLAAAAAMHATTPIATSPLSASSLGLTWSDVVGDAARQSLPHMAILPHEAREYEFKSLVPVKPRCGENAVRKMMMLFPKFASGCLNAQVDGHMFFGVVDGKSENDAACARELGWIGADEQLEHGQLVGVRLPKPARGHMADWLQPQIETGLERVFKSCPELSSSVSRCEYVDVRIFELRGAANNRVEGEGWTACIVRLSARGKRNVRNADARVPRFMCGYHELLERRELSEPSKTADGKTGRVIHDALAWALEANAHPHALASLPPVATVAELQAIPQLQEVLAALELDDVDMPQLLAVFVPFDRAAAHARDGGLARLSNGLMKQLDIGRLMQRLHAAGRDDDRKALQLEALQLRARVRAQLIRLYEGDPPSTWERDTYCRWDDTPLYALREMAKTVRMRPAQVSELRQRVAACSDAGVAGSASATAFSNAGPPPAAIACPRVLLVGEELCRCIFSVSVRL